MIRHMWVDDTHGSWHAVVTAPSRDDAWREAREAIKRELAWHGTYVGTSDRRLLRSESMHSHNYWHVWEESQ